MVIENDPSARMQRRSMGELVHPAQCAVCGNGTHEKGYLDLGVYYDYEGTVYLCFDCAYQAGETMGLYTPEEVKHSQDLIENLNTQIEELTKELEYARPIVTAFRSSFADALQFSGSSVDSALEEFGKNLNAGEQVFEPDASGEPTPEESAKVGGRTNSGKSKPRNITLH